MSHILCHVGKMESKDSFEEAKGEGKRCDEKGYDDDDDDWDDRGKEADSDEEVSSNDVRNPQCSKMFLATSPPA